MNLRLLGQALRAVVGDTTDVKFHFDSARKGAAVLGCEPFMFSLVLDAHPSQNIEEQLQKARSSPVVIALCKDSDRTVWAYAALTTSQAGTDIFCLRQDLEKLAVFLRSTVPCLHRDHHDLEGGLSPRLFRHTWRDISRLACSLRTSDSTGRYGL